jgi:hypothetical protein
MHLVLRFCILNTFFEKKKKIHQWWLFNDFTEITIRLDMSHVLGCRFDSLQSRITHTNLISISRSTDILVELGQTIPQLVSREYRSRSFMSNS